MFSEDSTKVILTELTSKIHISENDDDFIIIEHNKADTYQYQEVSYIDFNTDPYKPSELDEVIFQQYSQKYKFQQTLTSQGFPSIVLHIFQKQTQKIILFETVKDFEFVGVENYLPSLDHALQYYNAEQSYNPDDVIVIPIAEIARRHFRLLILSNNKISYYDSKSYFINRSIRSLAPVLPAASIALSSIEETVLKKIDSATSKIQHLNIALDLFGSLIYQTAIKYPNYYDCVKQVCATHFPNHRFYEETLAHQAYNDNTNCGPLVAAYAEQIAEGIVPKSVQEDPIELRARQYGYDANSVITTQINTEDDPLESRLSL